LRGCQLFILQSVKILSELCVLTFYFHMVVSQPKLFFLASKGNEKVVEFISLRKLFELLKQTA